MIVCWSWRSNWGGVGRCGCCCVGCSFHWWWKWHRGWLCELAVAATHWWSATAPQPRPKTTALAQTAPSTTTNAEVHTYIRSQPVNTTQEAFIANHHHHPQRTQRSPQAHDEVSWWRCCRSHRLIVRVARDSAGWTVAKIGGPNVTNNSCYRVNVHYVYCYQQHYQNVTFCFVDCFCCFWFARTAWTQKYFIQFISRVQFPMT